VKLIIPNETFKVIVLPLQNIDLKTKQNKQKRSQNDFNVRNELLLFLLRFHRKAVFFVRMLRLRVRLRVIPVQLRGRSDGHGLPSSESLSELGPDAVSRHGNRIF